MDTQPVCTGFATVPKVVDTDYHVMYIPAGLTLPNSHAPLANDMYLHVHLSGLAIAGLAPSHPIVANSMRVKTINWNVSNNSDTNKGAIKMSGKRKRGAPLLYPNSNICNIECDDGTIFNLRSVIKGRMVEVNARALLSNSDPVPDPIFESDDPKKKKKKNDDASEEAKPWVQPTPDPEKPYTLPLLQTDPEFSGFLSLFLITPSQMNFILNRLLTKDDFEEVLRQRALHDGDLVTFRKMDLIGPNGYQDIYEENLTNKGQTWGKGIFEAPKNEAKGGMVQLESVNSEAVVTEVSVVKDSDINEVMTDEVDVEGVDGKGHNKRKRDSEE